jgi:hypothetical protein
VPNLPDQSRLGEHAAYPGSFDPAISTSSNGLVIFSSGSPGWRRSTRQAASHHPIGTGDPGAPGTSRRLGQRLGHRVGRADRRLCRRHGVGVIIRGVRNRSDLLDEYQLAVMNQTMGITMMLLPAQPGLAVVSSTALRELTT